jgi:hypothetical protein
MHNKYTPKDIAHFWGKVDKGVSKVFYNGTRCWEWTASRNPKGYGYKGWGERVQLSHRVSWMITFGEIPKDLFVLHHCDNPPCCNPSHLFLGTNQDNVDDKIRKGRGADIRGENNPHCKLTDAQVSEIRKRFVPRKHGGDNTYTLAKEYGVSPTQIWRLVKGNDRT